MASLVLVSENLRMGQQPQRIRCANILSSYNTISSEIVLKQHSIHSKLTNHQSLQLSFLQRALNHQRSVITADSL